MNISFVIFNCMMQKQKKLFYPSVLKKIVLSLFLFCASSALFSMNVEFDSAAMFPESTMVLPIYNSSIAVIDSESDEDISAFKNILKQEFSIDWCNKNLYFDSRSLLKSTLSPILSNILPCDDVLFSKPIVENEGYKSFSFVIKSTGDVYDCIIKEGKLVTISLV